MLEFLRVYKRVGVGVEEVEVMDSIHLMFGVEVVVEEEAGRMK